MNRIKYSRTFHVPWSEGGTDDDKIWNDCSPFEGKEVVVSEKIDGQGVSIYPDGYVHARSTDAEHHPSRSVIKRLASEMAWKIPEGLRICGENLFAMHSILYTELPSYFLAFGVYDEEKCLSWDDTERICSECGLLTVPVLYRGAWDEKLVRSLAYRSGTYPTFETEVADPKYPADFRPTKPEGYVIRLTEGFRYENFGNCCAKFVRKNHVKTDSHWREKKIVQNLLKKD